MLLYWTIHTSLIQKRLSHSYQSKHYMCFHDFLWLRITIVALVLELSWYYNTSWVSDIRDLVLVLIFDSELLSVGDFSCWGLSQVTS